MVMWMKNSRAASELAGLARPAAEEGSQLAGALKTHTLTSWAGAGSADLRGDAGPSGVAADGFSAHGQAEGDFLGSETAAPQHPLHDQGSHHASIRGAKPHKMAFLMQ